MRFEVDPRTISFPSFFMFFFFHCYYFFLFFFLEEIVYLLCSFITFYTYNKMEHELQS